MRLIASAACLLLMAVECPAQAIRFEAGVFRVEGWSPPSPPASGWGSIFAVYAGQGDLPPLLGSYLVEGGVLVFRPKYPIGAGVHLRAELRPPGGTPVTATFAVERAAVQPVTHVTQVYPSGNVLPENALRLYVYFSGAMSEGEAWRRIHLLDSAGKAVELAFLELDQELWDRDHTRLTILFDPGRIKRGLLPLRESGKILEAGKSYTLAIDGQWPDGRGAPLTGSYRKEFRVGPARREGIDPAQWRVSAPAVGSLEPLAIAFPEALDYALLLRLLRVAGAHGEVEGTATVAAEETEWRFRPREPWGDGKYQVEIPKSLEDVAGNRVGRPFDVDTFAPITKSITEEVVALPFRPRVR